MEECTNLDLLEEELGRRSWSSTGCSCTILVEGSLAEEDDTANWKKSVEVEVKDVEDEELEEGDGSSQGEEEEGDKPLVEVGFEFEEEW